MTEDVVIVPSPKIRRSSDFSSMVKERAIGSCVGGAMLSPAAIGAGVVARFNLSRMRRAALGRTFFRASRL